MAPVGGGKAAIREGGQSILVAGADSDAVCGDFGSFTTAAGDVQEPQPVTDSEVKDRPEPVAREAKAKGPSKGGPSGGDPDPGGGPDPGSDPDPGGDPDGGEKGERGEHGGDGHSGGGDGPGGH